jgi:hypothetical protein
MAASCNRVCDRYGVDRTSPSQLLFEVKDIQHRVCAAVHQRNVAAIHDRGVLSREIEPLAATYIGRKLNAALSLIS